MVRVRKDLVLSLRRPIPGDADGRCEADAIRIGGDWSPGICVVSNASIEETYDVRKGYGYAGASIVYTGSDLAKFSVSFRVWRQDQYDAFSLFMKKYFTKPPVQPQQNGAFLPNISKPQALGIYHPALAELGIDACVYTKVGLWEIGAGAKLGDATRTIEFLQFRKPTAQIGKPDGAIPDVTKGRGARGNAPTSDDMLEMQIFAANQTLNGLIKVDATGHK